MTRLRPAAAVLALGLLALPAQAKPAEPVVLQGHRKEPIDGQRFGERHFYRKTALFDRFLSFDVRTEAQAAIRH